MSEFYFFSCGDKVFYTETKDQQKFVELFNYVMRQEILDNFISGSYTLHENDLFFTIIDKDKVDMTKLLENIIAFV